MKVSIIVPVYNAKRFISEALDSLIAQTFRDMEVVLIDDGSTDGSSEILDIYGEKYEQINVYHLQNGGVYNARLQGINYAQGDYIAFCDADDLLLPDMIEKLVLRADKTNADMIVCGYIREEMETGRVLSREMTAFDDKVFDVNKESFILPVINTAVWNKLIRREVVRQAIAFKQPPRILEDVMFLCSLYPFMRFIAFLPEPLYRYRVHEGSAMSQIKEDDFSVLKEDMKCTRNYMYICSNDDSMFFVCDSIAFIHFGLSIVIRQMQNGSFACTAVKEARKYLSESFPYYKKAGIGLIWNLNHHMILLKLLLARWLFCCHLITPALWVYNFITKKMKIEIKW